MYNAVILSSKNKILYAYIHHIAYIQQKIHIFKTTTFILLFYIYVTPKFYVYVISLDKSHVRNSFVSTLLKHNL